MFTELMEASSSEEQPRRERGRPRAPSPPLPIPPKTDRLPDELEDLSRAGYNSHSYRFTETEVRWLRRFCLRASERLDKPISHNTLFRVLLRLADQEWNSSRDANRLLDFLSHVKK
jgi:hypothetical protein